MKTADMAISTMAAVRLVIEQTHLDHIFTTRFTSMCIIHWSPSNMTFICSIYTAYFAL